MRPRNFSRRRASLVSIGGAGTFDGVFLSGILAGVLAAWIVPRGDAAPTAEVRRAA